MLELADLSGNARPGIRPVRCGVGAVRQGDEGFPAAAAHGVDHDGLGGRGARRVGSSRSVATTVRSDRRCGRPSVARGSRPITSTYGSPPTATLSVCLSNWARIVCAILSLLSLRVAIGRSRVRELGVQALQSGVWCFYGSRP